MVVAVTGGICTGKTVVAQQLAKALGTAFISLDDLSREVTKRGSEGYRRVVEAFGREILGPEGEIDRKALASLIFEDPEKREMLEGIVHPLVEAELRKTLEELGGKAVLEAPLLIEKGMHEEVDFTVLVYCSKEVQLRRLMDRDHLEVEEAERRIGAQLPLQQKVAFADYLVNNDDGLDYTREQVLRIARDILKKSPGGSP